MADPKILKRRGAVNNLQAASSVSRKCAQRNICLLKEKSGFLNKIWANGGRPHRPPLNPPLACEDMNFQVSLKSWWQISTVGRQREVSSRWMEPRQRKRFAGRCQSSSWTRLNSVEAYYLLLTRCPSTFYNFAKDHFLRQFSSIQQISLYELLVLLGWLSTEVSLAF